MSSTRGKILVVRGGAIGDFILTLPVLAALRSTFPQTRIEVLGYPRIAALAQLAGTADSVRAIEAQPLAGFFAKNGTLSPELQNFFAEFQIIISYLYDPDEIFRSNVLRCTKAQFIQGPHRPSETKNVHATDVYLEPLQRLAIFDADPHPHLPLHETARSNCVAIHPGSGSEQKNWPEAQWASFLKRALAETDHRFVLIGGEAEGNKLERLTHALPKERLEVAQNLPLPDLARKLTQCSFFLGHDSGITHLASACGLPGLILWGPSRAEIWRPRQPGMQILQSGEQLSQLSVDSVYSAFRQHLGREK